MKTDLKATPNGSGKIPDSPSVTSTSSELEVAKVLRHQDRFMMSVGIFVMTTYLFCLAVTVYVPIADNAREMFIDMRSTSKDAFWALVGYYFGSSAGSRVKDMLKPGGR